MIASAHLRRFVSAPALFRQVVALSVCLLALGAGFGSFVSAQSPVETSAPVAAQETNAATPNEESASAPEESPQVTAAQRAAERKRKLDEMVKKKQEEWAKLTVEERRMRLAEDRKTAAERRLRAREERERLNREHELKKAQAAAPLSKEGEAGKSSVFTYTGVSCVLQVRPFRQSVLVGRRFATEIALYSENAFEFDKIEVRLAYSPTDVRPLQVFDYPLQGALDSRNPPVFSPGNGLLSYSASLKRPIQAFETAPLLYVLWEAVGENAQSELSLARYGQPGSMNSSVYLGEKNLLEPKTFPGRSCVNATVSIVSNQESGRSAALLVPERAARPAASGATDESVRLVLKAPETRPLPGDEFFVEVFLDNPGSIAFDQVRLAVRFDPRKAEALDDDAGGWIRRGVNVSDAHAHGYFPFNIHTANEVSNGLGRISYDMGATALRPMPSGSLIRIRCRAKTEDAAKSFRLFLGRENRDWFTDVRAAGRSVLARNGSTQTRATALSQTQ